MTDAEILLLVFAANGGTMTKADAIAEAQRVSELSPADQDLWRQRIAPLVAQHAARVRGGGA